jgi:hypothetical protein
MSVETMSLDEYKTYISSMVSFTEMWKSCYFAMLSNPEYKGKQQNELLDLSWKFAKDLHSATGQYLESNTVGS